MQKRISMLLGLVALLSYGQLKAQCPLPQRQTLVSEHFEAGLPAGWEIQPGTGGGSWRIDSAGFGVYQNPGNGKWAYVDDEAANDIGTASILSASYQLDESLTAIQLRYKLNFQEYDGSGIFRLYAWDGGQWVLIQREEEDFSGLIEIDISALANEAFRLKFEYDDEGAWAWGMGIDDVEITAFKGLCHNGLCDRGESPEQCPTDCPYNPAPSPNWVPLGKDLQGRKVTYKYFKGNTACDDCSQSIELGFDFNFFGKNYRTLYINSNGNLTFEAPFVEYTPEAFCLKGPKMIAPFFADADLNEGGSIRYYLDEHYLVVSWLDMSFFGCDQNCDLKNSCQLILTDGSVKQIGPTPLPAGCTVVFIYGDMQWTTGSSSGGQHGFAGSAATVGMNSGDGQLCHDYGTFDHEGYDYYGNVQDLGCSPNGVSHLDHSTIFINGEKGKVIDLEQDLNFQAVATPQGNLLSWTGGSETAYFSVERAVDGAGFEEIHIIFPADSLQGSGTYRFVDEKIAGKWCVYRLVQVKENGTIAYSSEITVHNTYQPASSTLELLSYGPNPLQEQLGLRYVLPRAGRLRIALVDLSGRMVQHLEVDGEEGENQLSLPVNSLPAGIYVLNMKFDGNQINVNLLKK